MARETSLCSRINEATKPDNDDDDYKSGSEEKANRSQWIQRVGGTKKTKNGLLMGHVEESTAQEVQNEADSRKPRSTQSPHKNDKMKVEAKINKRKRYLNAGDLFDAKHSTQSHMIFRFCVYIPMLGVKQVSSIEISLPLIDFGFNFHFVLMLGDLSKKAYNVKDPTTFHKLAKDLLLTKKVDTWFSQNIDFLKTRAVQNCPQSIKARVAQLHGDISFAHCIKCRAKQELNQDDGQHFFEQLEKGPVHCQVCKGQHRIKREAQVGELLPFVQMYRDDPYWTEGEKSMARLEGAIPTLAKMVSMASKKAKVILVDTDPKAIPNVKYSMILKATADEFAQQLSTQLFVN
ncbi:hypothetical protein HDV05_005486 [Chytridiales sp. JEL 0842]|nr:hypothetical protein HDV05_005486 [Chytridiales sp. JEL 0842]